ncbi:CinA family protein [Nocardia sp. NPDC051030]|uniref:CinA family protein n=1 Tax=Nocardia sp. NPDC051030 TaxID=3155162 RepID=UPI00342D1576
MSTIDDYAVRIASAATSTGVTVAVAESLTCGALVSALGSAPDSAQWLQGAVVAYSSDVKRTVLGVPDVAVVSEGAACAMAAGVRELLHADIAVAVTGVGGPGPQDGEPTGSVWFAIGETDGCMARHEHFEGPPERVVRLTVETALAMILRAVHDKSQ